MHKNHTKNRNLPIRIQTLQHNMPKNHHSNCRLPIRIQTLQHNMPKNHHSNCRLPIRIQTLQHNMPKNRIHDMPNRIRIYFHQTIRNNMPLLQNHHNHNHSLTGSCMPNLPCGLSMANRLLRGNMHVCKGDL